MIEKTQSGLTVIILTFNEELHISRAIQSVRQIASDIIVIDSFSTDDTIPLCKGLGARVIQHEFTTQSLQLQWGLDTIPIRTEWVMRLDADEYLTVELASEITKSLDNVPADIHGFFMKRRLYFMGKWIRHGGYYPVKLLRVWRHGSAFVQNRLMDEHMILSKGRFSTFENDFIDENLHTLTSWIAKHNNYATREAIQLLSNKGNILTQNKTTSGGQTRTARRTYESMPLFIRCLIYFLYRYIFRAGFLDGIRGLIWHTLQGFWYRFLVDSKVYQIKYLASTKNKTIAEVIMSDYSVDIHKKTT